MAESPVWRLIPRLDAPGPVQMAIDTWLLDQHQHHQHPPTLRFYTWKPVALSLGVSQRRHVPDHWHSLQWQGQPVDLVQRPTGGRGVLHQGDLTYAVVTSHIPGHREQVYRTLCQFLIEGWLRLGVELRFGEPDGRYMRSPNCFGLATSADLIDAYGTKRVGSAQLIRGNCVLQHGSMPLTPDGELFQRVFKVPVTPPSQGNALRSPTRSEIIAALTAAAARCFGCQLVAQPLMPQEWQAIQALAQG
ncbi:MAG: lipoate--protein ligase family protein [Nodosilinea sp.]